MPLLPAGRGPRGYAFSYLQVGALGGMPQLPAGRGGPRGYAFSYLQVGALGGYLQVGGQGNQACPAPLSFFCAVSSIDVRGGGAEQ